MPNNVWTPAQQEFIRQNAGVLKDSEIATKLSTICGRHVSLNALRKQRAKLGIKKRRGRGKCEVSVPLPIKVDETSSPA